MSAFWHPARHVCFPTRHCRSFASSYLPHVIQHVLDWQLLTMLVHCWLIPVRCFGIFVKCLPTSISQAEHHATPNVKLLHIRCSPASDNACIITSRSSTAPRTSSTPAESPGETSAHQVSQLVPSVWHAAHTTVANHRFTTW